MRCEASGPWDADIMFVGEAPGKQEEEEGIPLIGKAGELFDDTLIKVGLKREEVFATNLLMDRPPNNDFTLRCVKKAEANEKYKELLPFLEKDCDWFKWPATYTWDKVHSAGYLDPDFLFELARLYREITVVKPNLVVAMGNPALWALTGHMGITKLRGAITEATLIPRLKVLPTFHPAHILRNWQERPSMYLDFRKAKSEKRFPDVRRPERFIWIEPTIADLWEFWEKYLKTCRLLSVDVETKGKTITCIGFGADKSHALVIPFMDERQPDYNYWRTPEEEAQALKFVQFVLKSDREKVGQNISYDIMMIWLEFGVGIYNIVRDTMLSQHAIQPESKKSLGVLGGWYTDEPAWKIMRERKRDEVEKRED